MSFARLTSTTAVALLVALALPSPAAAATAIDLGTATSFAVLAGSGITNTGPTTIAGDVGTFPTTSMTGFDTVTLAGVNHGGDGVTQQAKADLTAAYDQAVASAPATSVATELGGRTLTPGTYHGVTLGITGALTLDTLGDPNAVFVFQTDSTLITASASSVVVLGGSTACNVFWQVGSSATFGASSTLVGSVLADTSISAGDGATFEGRLLARGGAVTLQRNTISARTCAAAVAVPPADAAAAAADGTATPASLAAGSPEGGSATAPAPTPAPTVPTSSAATPPRRTTSPGSPQGGSTTGVGRPGLATTGPYDGLAVAGASTVGFGLVLLGLSRPLVALRHAVPRPGRTLR